MEILEQVYLCSTIQKQQQFKVLDKGIQKQWIYILKNLQDKLKESIKFIIIKQYKNFKKQ